MIPIEKDDNGWNQYQKLVIDKLDNHSDRLDCIDRSISVVREDIATLKVKAGVWGLVGGMIPVLIFVLIKLLSLGDIP